MHTIRVLLVDDYQAVLEGLQRMLATDETIEVVGVAQSGEEAINKAMALSPDVITMDIRMNGLDGIDTTRRLKANDDLRSIPVIALTSHAMVGDEEKALAAGCDDYLVKPLDEDELMAKIARYLE